LAAIILMIAAHVAVPLAIVIPLPWRFVGFLPLSAGIGLNLLADRELKRAQTTVKPFEASTALVTDSVFAWSRNPMYLGMVLLTVGVALFAGSVSPWVVVIGFALLLDRAFIRREEQQLNEIFDATFQRYRSKVRRWL
jgi:protein-S-isoprenylcysteine O-methyltransferase Ste14